jgi:hypothetical protein
MFRRNFRVAAGVCASGGECQSGRQPFYRHGDSIREHKTRFLRDRQKGIHDRGGKNKIINKIIEDQREVGHGGPHSFFKK